MPTPSKSKMRTRVSTCLNVVERYYPQLCEWAAVLTRGDQTRSEDIVHDLYLYIALTEPDLSQVKNLDNYLYQSLRHAYLSALARAARESTQTVSTVDFDSIRVALWARPTRDVLQQQNELRRICCYAVWRKSQMKGASYFVLRFFHGYALQEIVTIAGLPFSAVESKLSEARTDVRQYLAGSSSVRLVSRTAPPEPVQLWTPVSWPGLSRELRAMILDDCAGPCLSDWELAIHYRSPAPKAVPTDRLSHIVSCARCLAVIDNIFRRPDLKDRDPLDGVEGFDGHANSRPDRARPHSNSRALLHKVEKHCEDLFRHRPDTLSIAFDGKIIASHEVRAQRNVLSARTEKVSESTFVEVLTEQGLCLAMLWFDDLPSGGPHKKMQRTNLSEDRLVDLTLTVDEQGLTAEVVYFVPQTGQAATADLLKSKKKPAAILLDNREQASSLLPGNPPDLPENANRKPRIGPRWCWSRSWLDELIPVMNLSLATALVLAVGSLAYFLLWWHQLPHISADAFIVRAEASDSAEQRSSTPGVVYQRISIKTSDRIIHRAIYRDAQGARRPRLPELSAVDAQLKDQLAAAGVNWDEPLSAMSYQDWHNHQQVKEDGIARAGAQLLRLTTTVPDGPVRQESLTVRESDFHPVARTVDLRGAGTIEIAELNYDVLPWGAVNQDWFEPSSRRAATDAPVGILPALKVRVPHLPSALALDEAEIQARTALNQLNADTGEQILVARGMDGIRVKGVVDTDARKDELVVRLSQLPHIQTSILSVEELNSRPQSGSLSTKSQAIHVYSVEAQASPLERYVRERQLPLDQLASASQSILDSGLSISQGAGNFADLQPRFEGASRLPVNLQNQLANLSGIYLDTIKTGLDANDRILHSLGLDDPSQTAALPELISRDGDMDQQVRHYQELCQELITSGREQPRPAATIARELIGASEHMRLLLTGTFSTIPTAHDQQSTSQLQE